jgi:hypothetical protein
MEECEKTSEEVEEKLPEFRGSRYNAGRAVWFRRRDSERSNQLTDYVIDIEEPHSRVPPNFKQATSLNLFTNKADGAYSIDIHFRY